MNDATNQACREVVRRMLDARESGRGYLTRGEHDELLGDHGLMERFKAPFGWAYRLTPLGREVMEGGKAREITLLQDAYRALVVGQRWEQSDLAGDIEAFLTAAGSEVPQCD